MIRDSEKVRVIIGGDVVPTEDNKILFESGNIDELVGKDIINIIENSDIFTFNLEAPLTDSSTKIKKSGPHLKANKECVNAIYKLKPDLISLANNHILDYGELGLKDTKLLLQKENIDIIGVGSNIYNIQSYKIINIKDKKIGFFSCADYEFTIATETRGGANPYDPLITFDEIKKLKENVDYLIVLFHGGKEYYRYPSPKLQKICRKFVDSGADFITCQHSHCIGSKEEYKGKTILYGQGNFIFTYRDRIEWQEGLLLEIFIDNDIKINFIPFYKKGNKIRLAKDEKYNNIIEQFNIRSEKIKNKEFLKDEWQKFCENNEKRYLKEIIHLNIFEKILNKITLQKYYEFKKKKNYNLMLSVLNNYQCEAHREVVEEILRKEVLIEE